jgi:nucleoid-associated protein YgaU
MRSEVKIGIICAFVLVLGLVSWFVWSPSKPERAVAGGGGAAGPSGETGPRVPPPGRGLGMSPSPSYADSPAPVAPAATTGPGSLSDDPRPSGLRDQPSPATAPAYPPLSPGLPDMGHVAASGPAPLLPPGFGATTLPGTATEYAVKKGDSVWTIAKQFKVSRASLMAANNLTAESILHEKQVLKIPASGTGMAPTTRGSTHPGGTATTHAAPGTRPAGATYTVKAGDSLRKIAKNVYSDESKWKQIYTANKAAIGSDANDITAGMVLKIP